MKARFVLWIGAAVLACPALAQAAQPYYPPSGFDLSAFDKTPKPGDDFFQYANGSYLARAVIPADRPTVSRRFEMSDRMDQQLKTLLEESARGVAIAPTTDKGKVGAFYASFMDQAA